MTQGWIHQQCRWGFEPWVRKTPWRKKWQSIPVFLAGKPHDRGESMGSWRTGRDLATKQQNHKSFPVMCFGCEWLRGRFQKIQSGYLDPGLLWRIALKKRNQNMQLRGKAGWLFFKILWTAMRLLCSYCSVLTTTDRAVQRSQSILQMTILAQIVKTDMVLLLKCMFQYTFCFLYQDLREKRTACFSET